MKKIPHTVLPGAVKLSPAEMNKIHFQSELHSDWQQDPSGVPAPASGTSSAPQSGGTPIRQA